MKTKTSPISKKANELKRKEKSLTDDIQKKTGKYKSLVLWIIGAGVVTFILYKIYTSFSKSEKGGKKKEGKREIQSNSSSIFQPFMDYLVPKLSNLLFEWIQDKISKR